MISYRLQYHPPHHGLWVRWHLGPETESSSHRTEACPLLCCLRRNAEVSSVPVMAPVSRAGRIIGIHRVRWIIRIQRIGGIVPVHGIRWIVGIHWVHRIQNAYRVCGVHGVIEGVVPASLPPIRLNRSSAASTE